MSELCWSNLETPGYELLNFQPAKYPEFVFVKPEGYLTGDTEAMSGYVSRLANAAFEWTTPFSWRLISNHAPKEILPNCRNISATYFYTVNGARDMALRFSTAIVNATAGEIRADTLTLLPLKNIFERLCRGVLKSRLEWCHLCWQEDRSKNKTPYVRLYWLIQSVSVCCVHDIKLQATCAKCGEHQLIFSPFPRQWLCNFCCADLPGYGAEKRGKFEEVWASHSIYRLIDRVLRNGYEISEAATKDALRRLMLTTHDTVASLSFKLNVAKHIVDGIYSGRRCMFAVIIDLCYRLDIPIDQFVLDKDVLVIPSSWRDKEKKTFVVKAHIPSDKKQRVKKELQNILKKNPLPAPRLSHIATKFDLDHNVLEYHFPTESLEIRRRWKKWFAGESTTAAKRRLEKVLHAVMDLVRHDVYPSDRKLRDLGLVLPSDLRREEVIMVVRALQASYQRLGLFNEPEVESISVSLE